MKAPNRRFWNLLKRKLPGVSLIDQRENMLVTCENVTYRLLTGPCSSG